MSWEVVEMRSFLSERKGRYKPDDNVISGLKRIDKIDFSGNIFLSENPSKTDMILIKQGDLVISGINVEKGAMSIYKGEDDVIATIHYSSYEYNPEKIDTDFLRHFLKSSEFIDALKEQVPGGIKTEIKPKHILPLKVFIPTNVEEQREVVAFLDEQNKIVENQSTELTHQLDLVKQLRQAFLREAMQGKLVPQNPNDEPASVLLEKIKAEKERLTKEKKIKKQKPLPPITEDEIPFEIPENWVWCRLGTPIYYAENLDIQKNLSPSELINYVDIDAIDNTAYCIREAKQKRVEELSSRARRVLKNGFIVYSTVRPYLKNIAIIEDELPNMIGSTGFNVFKPIQIETKYLFYFLLNPDLNAEYEKMMIGFNSPSITNIQFENTLLPIAPLTEQQRIVAKLDELMAFCDELEASIKESQQQNEQLLQQVLREALEPKEKEVTG